jgi:hypothetical protein
MKNRNPWISNNCRTATPIPMVHLCDEKKVSQLKPNEEQTFVRRKELAAPAPKTV